jgi:hypothetical protein
MLASSTNFIGAESSAATGLKEESGHEKAGARPASSGSD